MTAETRRCVTRHGPSASKAELQTSETGTTKLKADFSRIMLFCGFPTQAKEHYEKDADSLHPDSGRSVGAVHNNRTG
jgi:hypothetical protein